MQVRVRVRVGSADLPSFHAWIMSDLRRLKIAHAWIGRLKLKRAVRMHGFSRIVRKRQLAAPRRPAILHAASVAGDPARLARV